MTLHAWLTNKLIATGHLSPTGSTRRAQPRHCPTCRADVIFGDDNDRTALETTADPTPLNPLGEALAHIEGRTTVALVREAGRLVMWRRYDLQIAAQPAGTRPREDILREHRCGTPPLTPAMTAPSRLTQPTPDRTAPPGSPAPF